MTAVPPGAPRKGGRKGGRLKNPEGVIEEANRRSRTIFTELYTSKVNKTHF